MVFIALISLAGCQTLNDSQRAISKIREDRSGVFSKDGTPTGKAKLASNSGQSSSRFKLFKEPPEPGSHLTDNHVQMADHEERSDSASPADVIKTLEYEGDELEEEHKIVQASYFQNDKGTAQLSLSDAIGAALELSNSVKLVRLEAEFQNNAIDSAQSRFDPVMNAGLQFADADRQVSSAIEARGLGLNSVQNRLVGGVNGNDLLSVEKSWESGTRAKLGYVTSYEKSNPAGQFLVVNPALNSALNFSVEQPLWQGRDSEFNTAPVRLARVNANRSFHQSQAEINELLFNVERNYWSAYQAEQDVLLLESLVKQAGEIVNFEQNRLKNGEGNLVAEARAVEYFESLRAQLAQSQLQHRQRMNGLVRAIGFDAELVPKVSLSDQPAEGFADPSLERGLKVARQTRPELATEQERLTFARIQLKQAKEYLKPAVNLVAGYSVTGLNDSIFGSLTEASTGQFGDFSLGVRYQRPFGKRREKAQVREAENTFHQARLALRRVEDTIEYEVRQSHQKLEYAYEVLERQRSRIKAAERQVSVYEKLQVAGKVSIDQVFDARESLLKAKRSELSAVSDYNIALSEWKFAIGQMTSRIPGNEPQSSPVPEPDKITPAPSDAPGLLPVSASTK